MIVYVESNFVLEVVLQQKEAPSVEAILALAASGKIKLIFPGFALSEPFSTLMRIRSDRQRWQNSSDLRTVLNQLKQSERSEIHRNIAANLQATSSHLASFNDSELDFLHRTIERIFEVGQVLNIDMHIFKQGLIYRQRFSLQSQDSLIYASIFADAQAQNKNELKCFLSRNSKDFKATELLNELRTVNCRYMASFSSGLDYIRSTLRNVGGAPHDFVKS